MSSIINRVSWEDTYVGIKGTRRNAKCYAGCGEQAKFAVTRSVQRKDGFKIYWDEYVSFLCCRHKNAVHDAEPSVDVQTIAEYEGDDW